MTSQSKLQQMFESVKQAQFEKRWLLMASVGHSGGESVALPNRNHKKISQHDFETSDWLPVSPLKGTQRGSDVLPRPSPSEQDVMPQCLHARRIIRSGADDAYKLRLRRLFWGPIDIVAFDSSSSV